ncbi:MAG: DUF6198 family protein [Spirochaetales bacterium]|uniref:DUF6198 family protein n=1 Tax=Candidatus Thalassospirochaeta sargassi TaxID=3119039 RepID=A0AAJ1IDX5_9SPIO|nr:DUF6198 family protein [Spirochaetales bacterium]
MKIRINKAVAFFSAQLLLSSGLILSVKADFGISVATSPAYVLSLAVEKLTFGTISYLYQGLIFLLMLIIIREIKLRYFLSFLSAVIFGYAIDGWTWLLRGFIPDTIAVRLVTLAASVVLMSIGIATFVVSTLPMLPFDIFVRKLSDTFGYRFSRVKLIFDLSNLAASVIISLLLFDRLEGVWWATFIFAVVLGPSAGFIIRHFNQRAELTGNLPGWLSEEKKVAG